MSDRGKVAIITGASRGIGKQTTLRLARHGVNLVLGARTVDPSSANPGSLAETAAEARALGVEAIPVKCDITLRQDVENLCHVALDKFGRVDILLNNAACVGETVYKSFFDLELDTWEEHFRGNVMATIISAKLCLPGMIKNGGGRIVSVSSRLGRVEPNVDPNLPGQGGVGPVYPATKAALNRLAIAMAKETRQFNIPVIAVEPGRILTEVNEMRLAEHGYDTKTFMPMSVAAAALEYLCLTCPDPMKYTGQVIVGPQLVQELQLQ